MAVRTVSGEKDFHSSDYSSGRKGRNASEGREKMILTTFSIEPSVRAELMQLFESLGLGWAGGVRFALKEFYRSRMNR